MEGQSDPSRAVGPADTAILPRAHEPREKPGATWIVRVAGAGSDVVRLRKTHTYGRAPDADVVVADDAVSRYHARLTLCGDRCEVVDLGSSNGTFLDGRPVSRGTAAHGSVLRIGSSLFVVQQLTEAHEPAVPEGPLVGGSSLSRVRRVVSVVGPADLPVLLLGETGTGKEVVARMLHAASRRSGAFIPINCAALPPDLVESELFGHARGAFTGADRPRSGLVAAADGGTLFLDELGELPLPAQAKLLRFLEDGVVRPLGSDDSFRPDVRVVSATNRPLTSESDGTVFRSDLLARLAVVELSLPPLRSRREDIPALAGWLLSRAGRAGTSISIDAQEAMLLHDYPMNVRELSSLLRGATLFDPERVELSALPERVRARWESRRGESASWSSRAASDDKRERLLSALQAHHGNVSRASRAIGLSRAHVYRLMNEWGVDAAPFRRARAPETSRR